MKVKKIIRALYSMVAISIVLLIVTLFHEDLNRMASYVVRFTSEWLAISTTSNGANVSSDTVTVYLNTDGVRCVYVPENTTSIFNGPASTVINQTFE